MCTMPHSLPSVVVVVVVETLPETIIILKEQNIITIVFFHYFLGRVSVFWLSGTLVHGGDFEWEQQFRYSTPLGRISSDKCCMYVQWVHQRRLM
jgi:hypothetical protein